MNHFKTSKSGLMSLHDKREMFSSIKRGVYLSALAVITGLGIISVHTHSSDAAMLSVCPSGCMYSDIQTAVNAAAANDTISIGPGVYSVTQILISKPLTIVGAGQGQTIIDGGQATIPSNGSGTIRINTWNTGQTIIEDMTIRNAGSYNNVKVALSIKASRPNSLPFTARNLTIEGTDDNDYGIRFYGTTNITEPPALVDNVTVSGTTRAGLLVEDWRESLTVQNSNFQQPSSGLSNIFIGHGGARAEANNGTITISNNTFTGQALTVEPMIPAQPSGGIAGIVFSGNQVTNLSDLDKAISITGQLSDLPVHLLGDIAITDNIFIGNGIQTIDASNDTQAISITGYADAATIERNEFLGLQRAIVFSDNSGGSINSSSVTLNRFASSVVGVDNTGNGTIDAPSNWWGCNGDPHTTPICASAKGDVTTDTWVVRTNDAPNSITSGQTITINFSFNTLNTGDPVTLPSSSHELTSISFTAPTVNSTATTTTGTDAINASLWSWIGEDISINVLADTSASDTDDESEPEAEVPSPTKKSSSQKKDSALLAPDSGVAKSEALSIALLGFTIVTGFASCIAILYPYIRRFK